MKVGSKFTYNEKEALAAPLLRIAYKGIVREIVRGFAGVASTATPSIYQRSVSVLFQNRFIYVSTGRKAGKPS
jgi:hypothetical protein